MPNENSYEVALQKSNAIREGLAKTPEKFTMLTGDRPTGRLHLGHYFGTLKGRVELQNMGAKTNVLIADYQVITDRDTTEHIQANVYNMVIDYLACGIAPDKTMIYAHSAVPAANQLMLPFLSLVSEAELARNPTVKAEMEASGHELTGQKRADEAMTVPDSRTNLAATIGQDYLAVVRLLDKFGCLER